jgi:hypothetical protein
VHALRRHFALESPVFRFLGHYGVIIVAPVLRGTAIALLVRRTFCTW